MADGLVRPGNRMKQIDDAETAALAPTVSTKPAPTMASAPGAPITADQAAANQKARMARDAADAAAAKGMVKPGLLDRAKKLIGLD